MNLSNPQSNHTIFIACLHPNRVYQFGPPDSYYFINIPLIVINSCLLFLIVLGNATVILAYFRNPTLQNVPNMLLINLAFTDLLVGVVAEPLFLAILVRDILGAKPICWLALLSSLSFKFCGGASLMILSLIISVERYLAICHPLKHRRSVTRAKVKKAIFILWFLLVALSASLLLGISYSIYFAILTLLTFIAITVTSFACYGIIIKLRKRRNRHKSRSSVHSADICVRIRSQSSASTSSNETEKRDVKIVVTMFYIIGAIVVCYTPMFAAIMYVQVIGNRNELYLKYFYPTSMTLISLNSFLNPVIYCLRNKRFMSAIRKINAVPHGQNTLEASNCYTITL